MDVGKLGVFFFCDAMTAPEVAGFARRIQDLGYQTLWFPEALGREALASAAWLLANTETLNVATGIANIYARDAVTMAAGQKTLAEQSGGRFLLGIGVSHRPLVQDFRGHAYDRPLEMMRGYLEQMANAPYTAIAPARPAPTVIGALHPKMLALAAEKTTGAHPYLVPPEHTAFARELMGESAWICTEQKVLLETDASKARRLARATIGMYLGLPNYRRSLKRFGLTDADLDNGGTDRCVDMVVAWGDEKAIEDRIRAHHDAGANHVCIQPINPDGIPAPDWRVLEAFAPAKN